MKNTTIIRAAALAVLAIGCAGLPSFAQTIVTGEIAGRVKDPTGAAVPNTEVSAKSDATGDVRTSTTNEAGEYRLPLLQPGSYTISVNAKGFQPVQLRAVASLGQAATVDIALSLASQSQTVQVSDVLEPLLQAENANIATTLDTAQLQNLPVGGGDMVAYTYGVPGITMSTGAGYGAFTAFGLPATSNLFTINGADYMDPYLNLNNSGASNLSIGANELQEAAVVTNGYTGQYGRQAGAQVNYITKSGSNAFHGNLNYNWNGNYLNANDFFNVGNPTPHAVSNQYSASLGGPIKKDKLFFFYNYEGLRYVLPNTGPNYIPTTAFANATIANLQATNPSAVPFYNTIFNLYANAPGANRAVPVSAGFDPALGCGDLQGSLGAFGLTQPCARTYEATANNLNTEYQSAERVDYNATDRDKLYFRAWLDRGIQATYTDLLNPVFNTTSKQPQWSTQLGYTHIFTPNSVNDLNVSGFYYVAIFGNTTIGKALATFPTTLLFGDGLFSTLGGEDYNFPQGRKVSQYQIVDDYSYIHGRHNFKVGVNFRRNDVGDASYGVLTSGETVINSITDFYNGTMANGSFLTQNFAHLGSEHIGLFSLGAYGQDQWKVRPDLTITLAIRFEGSGNPSCGRNCFDRPLTSFNEVNHDPTLPYNSVIKTGLSNAFQNLDKVVPQPRIGVAWTVAPKTVIRGGFGVFADQFTGDLATRFFTNAPNVTSFTGTSGIIAPAGVPGSVFSNLAASDAAFQNVYKSGGGVMQLKAAEPVFVLPNLNTQADNIHLTQYLEGNLEVQREISHAATVSLNYVASHGWNEINQNPFLNSYSPTGYKGLPAAAPDSRFGEILELNSTGYSNYQGLNASVKFRVKSLVGSVSYIYSHNLDTCSNNCLGRFNLDTAPSQRYDFAPTGAVSMYGNADYDTRHSLSANYLWNIPVHFTNPVLKYTLGGWAVAGTFISHSGYPFSVLNSSLRSPNVKNSSGVATIAVFPVFLGGPVGSCGGPDTNCLTKSQFANGPTALLTSIGRNAFRGPMYFDTDLNINKTMAIKEKYKFVIGATMFNVLNHPNFDLPVNNSASGAFGQILSTVSAPSSAYGSFEGSAVSGRVIVLNGKFMF